MESTFEKISESIPKNKPILVSGEITLDRSTITLDNIEMVYLGTNVLDYSPDTMVFKLTDSSIKEIKDNWDKFFVEFLDELGWIICWDNEDYEEPEYSTLSWLELGSEVIYEVHGIDNNMQGIVKKGLDNHYSNPSEHELVWIIEATGNTRKDLENNDYDITVNIEDVHQYRKVENNG